MEKINYLPDFHFYQKKMNVVWVRKKIKEAKEAIIEKIAFYQKEISFNFILELESLLEEVDKVWGIINHLNNVVSSQKTRDLNEKTLNDFNNFFIFIEQNEEIYKLYLTIKKKCFAGLNAVEKRIVTKEIEAFELNGIALEAKKKQEYKKNSELLLKYNTDFSNNVLDETDSFFLKVDNLDDLAGLPQDSLEQAAAEAKRRKLGNNTWAFTLQAPSFVPFMKYLKNENLRKKMYKANAIKATKGEKNNSPLIKKILNLRLKQAKLLDFENYAYRKLKNRMAKSPKEVLDFLEDLFKKTIKSAKKEKQEIATFIEKATGKPFSLWDIAFYSERLKEKKYAYQEEKIKEYFPYRKVMEGLFTLVDKLFGYRFVKTNYENTWHKDVEFYHLYDKKQKLTGHFYLDMFARPGKRGGAWMDECLVRKNHALGKQLPVAYLVTNFTPPDKNGNSLLTHNEVVTLLHEMGHVIHHLLTKVDYVNFSGINGVPWDGVELPSQFLENWAWEEKGLELLSSHYQTQKPLPKKYLNVIQESKNFHSALFMLRQLEFALLDMKLHLDFPHKEKNPHAIVKAVNEKISVFPSLPYQRSENSFTHIFGGGYAAGYYSYKWAEVLAADAFSVFKKDGIFNKKWAKQFLENILEKGGSEDFMKLYRKFRGKKPTIKPLLDSLGIK